jgi:hypothetical protein
MAAGTRVHAVPQVGDGGTAGQVSVTRQPLIATAPVDSPRRPRTPPCQELPTLKLTAQVPVPPSVALGSGEWTGLPAPSGVSSRHDAAR